MASTRRCASSGGYWSSERGGRMGITNPDPWARPVPMPTAGHHREARIHLAVGMALSRWELVESWLVMIFADTTGMDFMYGLQLYGSLPSSASKHTMLTVAAEAKLDP